MPPPPMFSFLSLHVNDDHDMREARIITECEGNIPCRAWLLYRYRFRSSGGVLRRPGKELVGTYREG